METYTIAIVDDEQKSIDEFKSCVQRYFAENGGEYKIVEFYDGKDLLEEYTARFDIIFLDIEMKEMNGIRAAKKIRSVDSHTAIIFLTRMERYAIKGYEVQAIDFIVKPLEYDKFVLKFKKALRYVKANESKILEVKIAGGGYALHLGAGYYLRRGNEP